MEGNSTQSPNSRRPRPGAGPSLNSVPQRTLSIRQGSSSSQPGKPSLRARTTSMVPAAVSPSIKEELWFGGHDNSVAEGNAARSMAALVGKIVGAKPFPESARRLADLTRSEVIRIEPVVQVLERDPALSARLLRLVNSAGYALRQRCTSVRHAATLVGTDRLHQIATTAAVLDMFDARGSLASEVLEHSTVTGAISRYLGAHLSLPVDDLFTAGFLHDIGKVMLLETEGDQYVELLTTHRHEASVIHVVERSLYGFDHAVLAAHVLTEWNIPDPVPKLVAWHHDSSRSFSDSAMMSALTQTLRLADLAAHMLLSGATREDFSALAGSECASYLDISEPQLASMWDDLHVLCEKSVEQCRGDQAPALEPRSMRPRQTRSPDSQATESPDLPLQFPCVVCAGPTFGNTCRACGGNMCPEHHVGRDDWCTLCARDFRAEKIESLSSVPFRLAGAIAASTLMVSAAMGYESGGLVGSLQATVGTFLLLVLMGVVLGVTQRWLLRARFLRTRPNRRIVEALGSDGGVKTIAPSVSHPAIAGSTNEDPLSELIRLAGDGVEHVIVDDVPSVPAVLSHFSRPDRAASLIAPSEMQVNRVPNLSLGWQPQANLYDNAPNLSANAERSQFADPFPLEASSQGLRTESPSVISPESLRDAPQGAEEGEAQSSVPEFPAYAGEVPIVPTPTLPVGQAPPPLKPENKTQTESRHANDATPRRSGCTENERDDTESSPQPSSLRMHPLAAIGAFPDSLSPQQLQKSHKPEPMSSRNAAPASAPPTSNRSYSFDSRLEERATLVGLNSLEPPSLDQALARPSETTELAFADLSASARSNEAIPPSAVSSRERHDMAGELEGTSSRSEEPSHPSAIPSERGTLASRPIEHTPPNSREARSSNSNGNPREEQSRPSAIPPEQGTLASHSAQQTHAHPNVDSLQKRVQSEISSPLSSRKSSSPFAERISSISGPPPSTRAPSAPATTESPFVPLHQALESEPPSPNPIPSRPNNAPTEDLVSKLAREVVPDLSSPLGEELKTRVMELVAQRVADVLAAQLLQTLGNTVTLPSKAPGPQGSASNATAPSPSAALRVSRKSRKSRSKR